MNANPVVQRINPVLAKEEPRLALQLAIIQLTNGDANHRDNATGIVPSLVNRLEHLGIGFAPDFSFFSVNYVSSEKSFVAVMPTSFAEALRLHGSFNASTITCIYKLNPTAENFTGKERRTDTGFKWCTGILSVGATDTLQQIEQAGSAAFASVSLKLVDTSWLTDKKAGGVGTGKVRFAFDINEGFEHTEIHRIRQIRLPSMATILLKPSQEFCRFYNIHASCLKSLDRRVKGNLVCTCSSGNSAGPSMSRASVESAKDKFRARALKRAREEPDPFA